MQRHVSDWFWMNLSLPTCLHLKMTSAYALTSAFHPCNKVELWAICLHEKGGWLIIPLSS